MQAFIDILNVLLSLIHSHDRIHQVPTAVEVQIHEPAHRAG